MVPGTAKPSQCVVQRKSNRATDRFVWQRHAEVMKQHNSLINEGKLMLGDCKLCGSDTQTLLSRAEHWRRVTFHVGFRARHVFVGASPKFRLS
jgi:hypothetical protein